jgi:hypothetical protein
MTTLIAWIGADSRGPSSIYLASDSRISWPSGRWDYGRKLFSAHTAQDIVGYCGDVLFPTQTLSQIFELIDRGLLFPAGTDADDRLNIIIDSLQRASSGYPSSESRDFDLLYCTRLAKGMSSKFIAYQIHFSGGQAADPLSISIPQKSGLIAKLGSGSDAFCESFARWKMSDVGGTSRSVFSALAESVRSGLDPQSGGPPQLVGIYREGTSKSFGIVWENRRFFCGMEVGQASDYLQVPWHNDLFEICDPTSLKRSLSAQPQPSPFRGNRVGKHLSKQWSEENA